MTMDVMDKHQIKHPDMVRQLAKSGEAIQETLNGADWSLLSEVVKMGINAGNYLDLVKKQVIYNKQLTMMAQRHHPYPDNLTPEKCHLLHMALGIFGEAAELLNATFQHVANDAPLDIENCVEESGDIEFYHEGFRQGCHFDRDTALRGNIMKLGERYQGHQYSDAQANERADKA